MARQRLHLEQENMRIAELGLTASSPGERTEFEHRVHNMGISQKMLDGYRASIRKARRDGIKEFDRDVYNRKRPAACFGPRKKRSQGSQP